MEEAADQHGLVVGQNADVGGARPLCEVWRHDRGACDLQRTPVADHVGACDEIADAREASRSYEANLKMFEQSRQMSASLLDLIRG